MMNRKRSAPSLKAVFRSSPPNGMILAAHLASPLSQCFNDLQRLERLPSNFAIYAARQRAKKKTRRGAIMATYSNDWPSHAARRSSHSWLWLALAAVVGITIGRMLVSSTPGLDPHADPRPVIA